MAAITGARPRDPAAVCRLDVYARELAQIEGGPHRDWRSLEPGEVVERFNGKQGEGRPMLATAIFVGTAQALIQGSYWAPFASSPQATEVSCGHLARPTSWLAKTRLKAGRSAAKVRSAGLTITCLPDQSPLDACAEAWGEIERHRIGLVRFSAARDPRAMRLSCTDCYDDQLFLRTSYYQALDKMSEDLGKRVDDALEDGDVIYTTGVGILRGPIRAGATWYQDHPRVDVLWVGLQANPRHDQQAQYADEGERAAAAAAIRDLFEAAAAHEVDVLVMPPLGCGTHGCAHPYLDMADLIHEATKAYDGRIPRVVLASDYPSHSGNWMQDFEGAVRWGRPPLQIPVRPPVPPFPRKPKTAAELQEKARRLRGSGTPRGDMATPRRRTFL